MDTTFLTKKLGPLSGAQWLALVGSAAVVFWFYRGRSSSSSATTTAQTAAAAQAAAAQAGASQTAADAFYGSGGAGGGTSTSTTGATYTDNNAWSVAAVNYLVSLGDDPTQANAAVQAWLNQGTLTAAQQAMVNLAILTLGEPPNPPSTSGGGSITTPPTGPTSKPVTLPGTQEAPPITITDPGITHQIGSTRPRLPPFVPPVIRL